ncbi:unnamed protein product, partial [Rotaria socialis]
MLFHKRLETRGKENISSVFLSLAEVSRLNTNETWELEYDEQLGSHTKLPNIFHDMIVSKASIIYENVLSVNVTKGERKFFDDKEAIKQAAIAVYRLLADFASVFQILI